MGIFCVRPAQRAGVVLVVSVLRLFCGFVGCFNSDVWAGLAPGRCAFIDGFCVALCGRLFRLASLHSLLSSGRPFSLPATVSSTNYLVGFTFRVGSWLGYRGFRFGALPVVANFSGLFDCSGSNRMGLDRAQTALLGASSSCGAELGHGRDRHTFGQLVARRPRCSRGYSVNGVPGWTQSGGRWRYRSVVSLEGLARPDDGLQQLLFDGTQ